MRKSVIVGIGDRMSSDISLLSGKGNNKKDRRISLQNKINSEILENDTNEHVLTRHKKRSGGRAATLFALDNSDI